MIIGNKNRLWLIYEFSNFFYGWISGLTAVSSAELLDIMFADFPDKYEELRRHMRDKQMKELSFKQKGTYNTVWLSCFVEEYH